MFIFLTVSSFLRAEYWNHVGASNSVANITKNTRWTDDGWIAG